MVSAKGYQLLFTLSPKDFEVTYFSGKGKGGQYRNRHKNCVRIKHPASGALVTGQSYRSRKQNMDEAKRNLIKHPKFRLWLNRMVFEYTSGKTIDEIVDEMMAPENLKIEYIEE